MFKFVTFQTIGYGLVFTYDVGCKAGDQNSVGHVLKSHPSECWRTDKSDKMQMLLFLSWGSTYCPSSQITKTVWELLVAASILPLSYFKPSSSLSTCEVCCTGRTEASPWRLEPLEQRETWVQNRCCYAPLKHFDHKSKYASIYTRGRVYTTTRANVMMNVSAALCREQDWRLSFGSYEDVEVTLLRFICTVWDSKSGFIFRTYLSSEGIEKCEAY